MIFFPIFVFCFSFVVKSDCFCLKSPFPIKSSIQGSPLSSMLSMKMPAIISPISSRVKGMFNPWKIKGNRLNITFSSLDPASIGNGQTYSEGTYPSAISDDYQPGTDQAGLAALIPINPFTKGFFFNLQGKAGPYQPVFVMKQQQTYDSNYEVPAVRKENDYEQQYQPQQEYETNYQTPETSYQVEGSKAPGRATDNYLNYSGYKSEASETVKTVADMKTNVTANSINNLTLNNQDEKPMTIQPINSTSTVS